MRLHLIIKLSEPVKLSGVIVSWQEFIQNKTSAGVRFTPEIDNIFQEFNIDYWVTHEYMHRQSTWSKDEISQGLDRIYRLILKNTTVLPERLVEKIRLIPYVEEVRKLEVGHTEIPAYSMTNQMSTTYAADMINLKYAHTLTTGNPDIRIAILDTGIDYDHPEIDGVVKDQYDMVNLDGFDTTEFVGDIFDADDLAEDEVGHGSHVAGIIAGKGINIEKGVAPSCSLMSIRVLASLRSGNKLIGAGLIDNINNGIKWAVDHGADVINMSLGVKHSGGGLPHEEVIEYALKKEVTIVAASGNDGTSEKYYPGALPNVIAVGATDENGKVTGFTSYGAKITVVAPGNNIYSSYTDGTYAFSSGTSQASPFVTGFVALMKSHARNKGKKITNEIIRYVLRNSSDRPDNRWRDIRSGYGLINMADAFKLLNSII